MEKIEIKEHCFKIESQPKFIEVHGKHLHDEDDKCFTYLINTNHIKIISDAGYDRDVTIFLSSSQKLGNEYEDLTGVVFGDFIIVKESYEDLIKLIKGQ